MSKNNNNPDGKKLYELAFLLKDPASEKSVLDLLSKYNASIIGKSPVNPLKLAYPVKKHVSAYFGYINFEADPASTKELSSALRLNSEVIRFLVTTAPVVKKGTEKSESKKAAKPEAPASSRTLTNEALEEKLEEILK